MFLDKAVGDGGRTLGGSHWGHSYSTPPASD
jgi:hypothetical protein